MRLGRKHTNNIPLLSIFRDFSAAAQMKMRKGAGDQVTKRGKNQRKKRQKQLCRRWHHKTIRNSL